MQNYIKINHIFSKQCPRHRHLSRGPARGGGEVQARLPTDADVAAAGVHEDRVRVELGGRQGVRHRSDRLAHQAARRRRDRSRALLQDPGATRPVRLLRRFLSWHVDYHFGFGSLCLFSSLLQRNSKKSNVWKNCSRKSFSRISKSWI